MHTPGLKVIVPSSPRDAKGLLTSAIFDEDPCIFVETVRLWAQRGMVPTNPAFSIPLGEAEVKRWSEHVQLDQVKVELDTMSHKLDHTYHLRSLATQVAGGIHAGSASEMMRQLLAQETELAGDDFEALCRVTLGALA